MENKEYLEKIKNIEKNSLIKSKEIQNNDYRQAKALEIIAEELIVLNYAIEEITNQEINVNARVI